MDIDNVSNPAVETPSDEDLLKQYHELDEESQIFAEVKAELEKRGYSFVAETEEESEVVASNVEPLPQRLPFSKAASLAWEIAYPVLAAAGIIFFILVLTNHGEKINTRLAIYSAIVFLLISSLGLMVAAVRRLTNSHKDASVRFPGLLYYCVACLWAICSLGAIYFTANTFSKAIELSLEYAVFSSLVPLIGTLISLAFTFLFFTFWKAGSTVR